MQPVKATVKRIDGKKQQTTKDDPINTTPEDGRQTLRGQLEVRWVFLLLWRVLNKADSLSNVALEAGLANLKEGLLPLVDLGEDVDDVLSTRWLYQIVSCNSGKRYEGIRGMDILTPSSTGMEKYSRPVSLAMTSPPLMPLR